VSLIEAAVGDSSPNKPIDVIRIQDLLNNSLKFTGLEQALNVDGTVSDTMVEGIRNFQEKHPGIKSKRPDGRVSPGGLTEQRLVQCKRDPGYRSTLPRGFDSNTLTRFNIDGFVALYARQYPQPKLGAEGAIGLRNLMDQIIADPEVTDLRWVAYMLATVKHECANTWLPIEENGKGAAKEYKTVVSVKIDDKTTVKNVYYGRGYVQLTWDHRYKALDKALGLEGDKSLYLHPENALDADVAYKIMSHGMRHGTFTGVRLSQLISGGRVGYLHARRIINGDDQAELIRDYAVTFEFLLRFCNGVPLAK
jgi:hypothetical protein